MYAGSLFGLGYFGAADAAVSRLQRALVLLGLATGDRALALKVDGLTGPGTAAAANRALTAYVTSAPANLRSGRLTPAQVKQFAASISGLVEAEAARRQRSPAAYARKPAVPTSAIRRPAVPAPARVVKPTKSPAVARLQSALRALGKIVKDSTLQIAVDGMTGPKTAAAANRALATFVPAAPASLKTGKLTPAEVALQALAIAPLVEAEIKRRTGLPRLPTPPSKAPSKVIPKRLAQVEQLQRALTALATLVKDSAVSAKADGMTGPKTAAAVNRAFTKYVKVADSKFKSGRLSPEDVKNHAVAMTRQIDDEIRRRGAKPPRAKALPEATTPAAEIPPEAVPATATDLPEAVAPPAAATPSSPAASAPPAVTTPAAAEAMKPPPEAAAPGAMVPGGGGATPGGGGGGGLPSMPPGAEPGAEPPAAPTAPEAKPFPWIWIAVGVGGAAVLGTGAYFAFRKKKGKRR